MPREAELSINEREFVLEALQQNIRVDGRALDAYRPIEMSFGDQYGVANIRLGETRYFSPQPHTCDLLTPCFRVLTRMSAAVTAPYPDRKFDGVFTITTELSPLASPAFEIGR